VPNLKLSLLTANWGCLFLFLSLSIKSISLSLSLIYIYIYIYIYMIIVLGLLVSALVSTFGCTYKINICLKCLINHNCFFLSTQ